MVTEFNIGKAGSVNDYSQTMTQESSASEKHEERMEVIKGAVTLLSSMIKLVEKNANFRHKEAMARIKVDAYNALTQRMQVTGKDPEPIDFSNDSTEE